MYVHYLGRIFLLPALLPPSKKQTNLKESGTPNTALGTERGLAIEDGSADVSPFVRALR